MPGDGLRHHPEMTNEYYVALDGTYDLRIARAIRRIREMSDRCGCRVEHGGMLPGCPWYMVCKGAKRDGEKAKDEPKTFKACFQEDRVEDPQAEPVLGAPDARRVPPVGK